MSQKKTIIYLVFIIIALKYHSILPMQATFKILFVTDIHLNLTNVQKLYKWHKQNNIQFNIILIGGDTGNCDQNNKTHDEQQQRIQTNEILCRIQQIFGCKMYFIPGNHDPLHHYQKNLLLKDNIQSIHQGKVLLSQGLQIIGFGGSVPGYINNDKANQIWKGYPFNSNQELTQYCELNKIFQNSNSNSNQKIYLTHCGPLNYQTSIDRRNIKSSIYGGAEYFNSLIEHNNLILYLHGHVHSGSRYVRVNEVPIINPGPLTYGQFGHFQLLKDSETKKWKLQSSHFVQL